LIGQAATMGKYIGVRLLHALVILALVTVLVFVVAQLVPGDAVMAAMAGSAGAPSIRS
jgi:ABC-type dipeptide/oligopeptide/nickel transport system permease component